jgi:ABC-type ATPase involved in cell division
MSIAPAGTPKIRIRGLTKHFGPKKVLDGIDLDIAAGTGLVVIGGSGTGKSVLIKSILGLVTPDAGVIEIDGENVLTASHSRARALRAQIGMLFQNGALFDSMSVWENVAFGLLAEKKTTRGQARGRAIDVLAQVGLDAAVAELSPAELSGGMQKRVALARAHHRSRPDHGCRDRRADRGLREAPGLDIDRDHPRHGQRPAHRRQCRDAVQRQDQLARPGQRTAQHQRPGSGSVHAWAGGRAHKNGAEEVIDAASPGPRSSPKVFWLLFFKKVTAYPPEPAKSCLINTIAV